MLDDVANAEDLEKAITSDVLRDGHRLEAKRENPSGRGANLELARDLATPLTTDHRLVHTVWPGVPVRPAHGVGELSIVARGISRSTLRGRGGGHAPSAVARPGRPSRREPPAGHIERHVPIEPPCPTAIVCDAPAGTVTGMSEPSPRPGSGSSPMSKAAVAQMADLEQDGCVELSRDLLERGPEAFASEAALMWPLAAGASALGKADGRAAAERISFFEVAAAEGVPDMLIVEFDQDAIQRRVAAGLGAVIATTTARALWALTERALTVDELAETLTMTPAHVQRGILPQLADAGLASRDVDGRWAGADGLAPLVRSVVAVEAKLSDWRGGFKQARRYTRFANQTYMALDARRARPARRYAGDMAEAGVGLATVDASDGRVHVRRRARWREPAVRWEFFLIGERVWERTLAGTRSGPTFDVFGRRPDPTPDTADTSTCAVAGHEFAAM